MSALRLLPLVASAALLAGCGGSSSPTSNAVDQPAAGASVSPTAGPGGSPPAAGSSGGATTAGSSTTGGGSARGPATTTTTGGADPASAQPPGTGSGTTSTPETAPGTYTYDTSGTVTAGSQRDASGTSTLTVDRPSGGKQHSVLADDQGRTEQVVVVRSTGTYLARLAISNPAFNKEFVPAAPVLLVPDPATPGRAWSWTATSTDGKTTVAVSAKVARRETVSIGGVQTATSVVTSTLRLTGDVTYTAQMETWYDPAHRLTVKDHTRGNGTFGGLAFQTDVTAVLRSTRPS